MITVTRTHEIACGHRVYGHESKCSHIHGHNYVFEMTCVAQVEGDPLDAIGRVIDFGDIKKRLCNWLEDTWDHKFLVFNEDPFSKDLRRIDPSGTCLVPFNPTVENIAKYFVDVVAPRRMNGTLIKLVQVKIWETSKCSATYSVQG